MNQEKVGKFIAERRRSQGLTQMQLAEKLNITDRAVSKWERGKCMPDVGIMLDLCALLKISVNDLLNGEVLSMENYKEKSEQLLLDMAKQKEESDKRLLRTEILTGVLCLLYLLMATILVSVVPMEEWLGGMIVGMSCIPLFIAVPFMIKIEQTAGYYECRNCGHRHVPTFWSVFWAMHVGWTRYMKCPACQEWSWNKKVLTKD